MAGSPDDATRVRVVCSACNHRIALQSFKSKENRTIPMQSLRNIKAIQFYTRKKNRLLFQKILAEPLSCINSANSEGY